ncbi:MAG: MBL fold metallo-hydrolase [Woeseiaceae bacterium]
MSAPLTVGDAVELAPGIRRLLAPNPGPMTGPGTNTYLIGEKEVAVIDPGPKIARHISAIQEAAAQRIKWILVTHTHPDHSPAACELAAATGAQLLGKLAPPGKLQDRTFVADRVLQDGDLLETEEFRLSAVHTPGHASNHLCYRHEATGWLFTGDHIMSGSTVVINPPDGDMKDYLESLARLKTLNLSALAPGHGPLIEDPDDAVDRLVEHRLKRESKVLACLATNPNSTVAQLTGCVYDDVPNALHPLAQRSLSAHLLKLEKENRADRSNESWRLT